MISYPRCVLPRYAPCVPEISTVLRPVFCSISASAFSYADCRAPANALATIARATLAKRAAVRRFVMDPLYEKRSTRIALIRLCLFNPAAFNEVKGNEKKLHCQSIDDHQRADREGLGRLREPSGDQEVHVRNDRCLGLERRQSDHLEGRMGRKGV